MLGGALFVLGLGAGCGVQQNPLSAGLRAGPTPQLPQPAPTLATLAPAPGVPGNPVAGRALITSKGCGGCHTVEGVPGATGDAGPNLTNVVVRPTLAGNTIPMTPQNLTRWLMDPRSVKPAARMPNVGLTPGEARDLTAFLYSQPYNPTP